jgi:hypothetical protein
MNMKSQRVHAHQEALKAEANMSDKPAGKSDATSMKLEVANSDPETARRRGLKSFDWRAEVAKHSRINKEQVGLLSPPWRGPAVQNASPRMERMRQPILLPYPNPQPPRIRPALGAPSAPDPRPFDPERILPRPLPRPIPKGATRRRQKIARTLPALSLPVAVQEQSQMSTQSLERISPRPESQSKLPAATRIKSWEIQSRISQKFSGLEEDGAKEFGSKA